MQKELHNWLKNPKRDYASGLALFNALARPEMVKQYGTYFNNVQETDKKPFSMKLNMMSDQLSKVKYAMKKNPELFVALLAKAKPSTSVQVRKIVALQEQIEKTGKNLNTVTYGPQKIERLNSDIGAKNKAIDTEKKDIQGLESEIEALEKGETKDEEKIKALGAQIIDKQKAIDSLTIEVEELNTDLEDKQSEIDDLEYDKDELQLQYSAAAEEIEALKAELEGKGLKVLSDSDLPSKIQEKRTRIKAIVPLMAVLHTEMSVETLTDDERKDKAEELCLLDDERRTLWDEVDDFLEGKESVLVEAKEIEYSDDPIVKGVQVAKRIERLKENIKRSQKSADTSKSPNIAASAQRRAEKYQVELDELESLVNDAK